MIELAITVPKVSIPANIQECINLCIGSCIVVKRETITGMCYRLSSNTSTNANANLTSANKTPIFDGVTKASGVILENNIVNCSSRTYYDPSTDTCLTKLSYIRLGLNSSISFLPYPSDVSTTEFAFELWFYTNTTPTNTASVLLVDTIGSSTNPFQILINSSKSISVNIANTSITPVPANLVTPNSWHYVAISLTNYPQKTIIMFDNSLTQEIIGPTNTNASPPLSIVIYF